jgi:hypothetical protein
MVVVSLIGHPRITSARLVAALAGIPPHER